MAIFSPETLNSALFPTFFFYRFLGTGLIQFPVRRQKWFLSLIYFLTICISYLTVFISFHKVLQAIAHQLGSSIASFAFYIFTSVSCLVIISTFVSVTFRYKEHHRCAIELMDIKKIIQEIGDAHPYQSSLRLRTWQFLGSLFICFIIIISDYGYYVQINTRPDLFSNALLVYIFDYPVLLSIFGDITFSVFNRVVMHSLEDINSLLHSMKRNHPNGYETRIGNLIRVEAIHEDKNKLKNLRCVRKIYFRLVKVAKNWAELNGLHVVSSTIYAIWLGTFHIHNLWLRFFNPEFKSQNPMIYAYTVKAIICHIAKLYLIVFSTTTLTAKARKTCDILLTYLHPIAFLRAEANEFALQLIQNPLRLTAVGLFDLDRTLIQMVIANVATYLVVLIQTDNLAFAANPPPTNPSANDHKS